MLPRKPPLPFVPGHKHLHHRGWPCHAYGAASLLRRIPVFLFGRHPDDYLTRLRGERSGDGTESFDARAVFGQQQHPLSRIGHEGRPVLAERHRFTNCIGLEPTKRLGDRDLSGQDLESLVVRVLVFERIGEGTGDVFAGDLTPPTDLLGRLYGSRSLILSQAAGTYYGVGEATALQTFVGAGLGAEIRTHRLRAPLRIVRANRAEHQVAAHPTFLRGLDQLGGPAVVHCLLALGPAPWSGAGGEDDRIAALDGLLDTPLDLLFFEVQQHGFGAVRLDVARLLLLADQPPHLVTILRQYPHQTSRRLAVRPRYEHLHAHTPFRSPFSLKRASLPSMGSSSPYKRMSIASTFAQGPGTMPGPIYGFLHVNDRVVPY